MKPFRLVAFALAASCQAHMPRAEPASASTASTVSAQTKGADARFDAELSGSQYP
jgi:hypothetical protein